LPRQKLAQADLQPGGFARWLARANQRQQTTPPGTSA
jgi:hypothetical protein